MTNKRDEMRFDLFIILPHVAFAALHEHAHRLGARHSLEQQLQLRVQQSDVAAAEHFGHERPPGSEEVRRDVDGRHEQLRLDVLVEGAQAGHVGSSVADDQLRMRGDKVEDWYV